MKFGLHSVNLHSCGYPDAAARFGRAAEAAGFESLWVADHVVLPDPPVPGRPMAPDMRLLEPIVALTFLAAPTSRVLLANALMLRPPRPAQPPTCPAAAPDRRGRTASARLSPRGDAGTRLVWIRARRGGDPQERGRAARGGQEVSTPGGAGHAGDQRDAARLRCS